MASARNFQSRIFLLVTLVTLSLFSFEALHAQEKAPLPGYVIEEFGNPPAVPEGPLSPALQSAMTVAFVNSTERTSWQEPQIAALGEIVDANDPRVAWLIADLMRFAPSRRLNSDLADAASQLLGIESPINNHWGVIQRDTYKFKNKENRMVEIPFSPTACAFVTTKLLLTFYAGRWCGIKLVMSRIEEEMEKNG
jgi:hypothetical protein